SLPASGAAAAPPPAAAAPAPVAAEGAAPAPEAPPAPEEPIVPLEGETEEDARARAQRLLSKPEFQKPPEEEKPPLSEVLVERLRPLVRPFLITLAVVAVLLGGYGVYYYTVGFGKAHREALADATTSIHAGYEGIKRGLETGDAALLFTYVPVRRDRPPQPQELKEKSQRLKQQA